jgi:hypothetical protein
VAPSIQRCENPTLPSLTRDKPSCTTSSSTTTGATSDQPDTRAVVDGKLDCGVEGQGVGHAGLVDDDQRRRSDPRRPVRKSAVHSDQASAGWSPNGTPASRRPSPNGDSTRSFSQRCRREEDPQRDLTGNTGPRIAQRGRFQEYAPGCFSAYQSPLHSEVGSSGGPHHGDRSKQSICAHLPQR